jgi:hypothetical protein
LLTDSVILTWLKILASLSSVLFKALIILLTCE